VKDDDNFYFGRHVKEHEFIDILISEGGARSQLASASVGTIGGDEWLKIEVDWKVDGEITVTLYRSDGSVEGTVSTTDSTFEGGGVGVRCNQNGDYNTYFDDIEFSE